MVGGASGRVKRWAVAPKMSPRAQQQAMATKSSASPFPQDEPARMALLRSQDILGQTRFFAEAEPQARLRCVSSRFFLCVEQRIVAGPATIRKLRNAIAVHASDANCAVIEVVGTDSCSSRCAVLVDYTSLSTRRPAITTYARWGR